MTGSSEPCSRSKGLELYESREGQWFRPGQSLPSFDEAPNRPPIGLDRAIVPLAFSSLPPPTDEPQPMELRLVADAKPRATTATLCALGRLAEWADRATSAEIGAIRAAVTDELALLIGPGLPFLADSGRYWGDQLLVPLGFSPWPVLPEGVIRQAIGANEGHLALLNGEGRKMTVEIIPFESFRPMTRAGVRLAMKGRRHES